MSFLPTFFAISEYTLEVPDSKTFWLFKDTLAQTDRYHQLFSLFKHELEIQDIISHEGTLIDASFIECPKQRNKRDETSCIKQGDTFEEWSDVKRHQKDVIA